MMYGAYGSEGWSVVWGLGMAFHMLFCLALFFGLLSGVIWMFKFATVKELRKFFKVGVIVGVVGLILSAPLMFWGAPHWGDDISFGEWDEQERGRGMMDWYDDDEENAAETTTTETTTTETVVE